MNAYTPCFPPLILEKCLEFAKFLSEKEAGKALLEINLGNSRFKFNVDHSSAIQAGSPRLASKKNRKSPSDYRRDTRRKEVFLEKKKAAAVSPPSAPPSSSSRSSNAPTEILKKPVTVDQATFTDPMTTDDSQAMDTIEENVPLETETRNKIESDTINDD